MGRVCWTDEWLPERAGERKDPKLLQGVCVPQLFPDGQKYQATLRAVSSSGTKTATQAKDGETMGEKGVPPKCMSASELPEMYGYELKASFGKT